MGLRISFVVIICLTLFPLPRAFGEDAVSQDGSVVKPMTLTQEGNSKITATCIHERAMAGKG